jgi:hypothetical protein
MYNNGQWPGFGQAETTDVIRELAEITPQLPIGKIVHATKTAIIELAHAVRGSMIERQAAATESAASSQRVNHSAEKSPAPVAPIK